jgi:hypothetical protein
MMNWEGCGRKQLHLPGGYDITIKLSDSAGFNFMELGLLA